MRDFFKQKGQVQPVYIYVFALFVLLFVLIGLRVASVFVTFKGSELSDTLILGLSGTIIGLLVNFNWDKIKGKCDD